MVEELTTTESTTTQIKRGRPKKYLNEEDRKIAYREYMKEYNKKYYTNEEHLARRRQVNLNCYYNHRDQVLERMRIKYHAEKQVYADAVETRGRPRKNTNPIANE